MVHCNKITWSGASSKTIVQAIGEPHECEKRENVLCVDYSCLPCDADDEADAWRRSGITDGSLLAGPLWPISPSDKTETLSAFSALVLALSLTKTVMYMSDDFSS